jgi:ABC-type dipeptide/oligopeptide/nickel transport system ATPase subunit
MNAASNRVFQDKPGVREATPLLLGLIGPSGGGKTYSALRLASGIQRVTGGDIFGIDTESRRMLHYADKFNFRHLQFDAPFGSLDYLAAIEHCVKKGGRIVIVDSMSHEHEGPGGVLEQHQAETARLAKLWDVKESKAQIAAWGKPKEARRRMINSILQLNANFIFCFRAKEKLKIVSGQDPVPLGFMPIAGEEFVYEMTMKCLLMPGSKGTPIWQSDMPGEKLMMKLPEQFEDIFIDKGTGEIQQVQLNEAIGVRLARWAAGDQGALEEAAKLITRYANCTREQYDTLEDERKALWPKLPAGDAKQKLQDAAHAAGKRVKAA